MKPPRALVRAGMAALAGALLSAGAAPALAAEGDLDPGFAGGGFRTDLCGGAEGQVVEVMVQPDGKIVTAGTTGAANPDFCVARYLPTGQPDPAFGGGDGFATASTDATSDDYADAATLTPGGKIVVVGSSNVSDDLRQGEWWVLRFDADGTPDDSFHADGDRFVPVPGIGSANGVAVEPDGEIALTGTVNDSSPPGDPDFGALRLEEDGDNDPDFNGGAVQSLDLTAGSGTSDDRVQDAVLQPDNKIVLVGTRSSVASSSVAVVRLNESGSVDSAWGAEGTILPAACGDAFASSAVLQPDGKLVLAGSSDDPPKATVTRINGSDASLDPAFNPNANDADPCSPPPGINVFPIADNDEIFDVVLTAGGRVLVGGGTHAGSENYQLALARLGPDGELDATFGAGGKRMIELGSDDDEEAYSIALQPDGGIVFGGYRDSDPESYPLLGRLLGPPAAVPISVPSPGPRTGRAVGLGRCTSLPRRRVRCRVTNRNPFRVGGTLALETARRVAFRSQRPRRRILRLATRRFAVGARRRAAVTLRLTRPGARLLARRKRLRVRLRATIRDEARIARRSARTFTLRALKKRRGR